MPTSNAQSADVAASLMLTNGANGRYPAPASRKKSAVTGYVYDNLLQLQK
ncbi:hypothetical protein [Pantoea sp. B65]